MSIKKEIVKDVVVAYKNFCNSSSLVKDENTVEYFIINFINMETKIGAKRAETLRKLVAPIDDVDQVIISGQQGKGMSGAHIEYDGANNIYEDEDELLNENDMDALAALESEDEVKDITSLKYEAPITRLIVENHAGHQFIEQGIGTIQALKSLAARLGYANNEEAGFVVIRINGVEMDKYTRGLEAGIALWEYIGHEDQEFWGWNNIRLITAK